MGMYPNQVHGYVPDSGTWVWSNGAMDYNWNALKIRKAFSPIRPPKRGVEKNVEKCITASGRNNDCPFDEMCLLISLKFEPKFKKIRFHFSWKMIIFAIFRFFPVEIRPYFGRHDVVFSRSSAGSTQLAVLGRNSYRISSFELKKVLKKGSGKNRISAVKKSNF